MGGASQRSDKAGRVSRSIQQQVSKGRGKLHRAVVGWREFCKAVKRQGEPHRAAVVVGVLPGAVVRWEEFGGAWQGGRSLTEQSSGHEQGGASLSGSFM